jgi:hypothetical protein
MTGVDSRTMHVLLAEDDSTSRKLVQTTPGQAGRSVVLTRDGVEHGGARPFGRRGAVSAGGPCAGPRTNTKRETTPP